MKEQWLEWAIELQSLAQAGLTYGKDIFDRERYERIREISAEIMAYKTDIPFKKRKTFSVMKQDTRRQNLIPEPLFFKMEKFFLLKRIAENGHFPEVGLM